MALYELNDWLSDKVLVGGLPMTIGRLLNDPAPLTPGQAIVAALFPALDAEVRDALGEFVGAWLAASTNNKLSIYRSDDGSGPLSIDGIGHARNAVWELIPSGDGQGFCYERDGYKRHSGPALLPAIKAATARMKG